VAVQQQQPLSWQEQQQAWGLTLLDSCGLCGTDAAGQRLWEQDSIAAPRSWTKSRQQRMHSPQACQQRQRQHGRSSSGLPQSPANS